MSQELSSTIVNRHPAHKQQRAENKERTPRRKQRRKLSPPVILVLGLAVPFSHSTQATELQYARAIGHEFLPQAPKKSAPTDSAADTSPANQLPQLGASEPDRQPVEKTAGSKWTKILVGVVVVGAMAALANRGGGGENAGTTATTSGAPNPASDTETSGSGTGIGIGGGGITITTGGRGRDRD